VPRIATLLAGLGGIGLAAFAFASPAAAHAMVVSSAPADGAHLAVAPARVSITFDEPVGIDGVGYLHVVDAHGTSVALGAANHPDGNAATIAVPLRSGLPAGEYIESYRVVSADSHPVTGAIVFTVGHVARMLAAPIRPPPATDSATGLAFNVVRWVGFAGFALLGGGWLVGTVWTAGRADPRARALAQGGAWAIAVGAAAELLVQGPYSAGTSLARIGAPAYVRASLDTEFGSAHLWRLGLIAALSYVLWTPRRLPWRVTQALAALLTVAIAVTFAASGHTWTERPHALVAASDTVHLVAMAAWLGGLVYLFAAIIPARDPDVVRTVLPTYSRVAFGCVVALAGSGTYQAWLGVGSLAALHTRYGELVILKAALFVGMVALGNASRALVLRRYLQPRAHARSWATAPGAMATLARGVRRTVIGEALIGATVLAATAVLVAEPPGAVALAAQHQAAHSATADLGNGETARLTVAPGVHGPVTVDVHLAGAPATASTTVTAALPREQLGPITVPLGRPVTLPAAGAWTFAIVVQTDEFDATAATVTIHIY
jgi:copper transport protein